MAKCNVPDCDRAGVPARRDICNPHADLITIANLFQNPEIEFEKAVKARRDLSKRGRQKAERIACETESCENLTVAGMCDTCKRKERYHRVIKPALEADRKRREVGKSSTLTKTTRSKKPSKTAVTA